MEEEPIDEKMIDEEEDPEEDPEIEDADTEFMGDPNQSLLDEFDPGLVANEEYAEYQEMNLNDPAYQS